MFQNVDAHLTILRNFCSYFAHIKRKSADYQRFDVPREGLEPSRRCRQQILSLPCLPFHHQGIAFFSRKAGAKLLTFSDVAKKSFANRIKRCIFALELKD